MLDLTLRRCPKHDLINVNPNARTSKSPFSPISYIDYMKNRIKQRQAIKSLQFHPNQSTLHPHKKRNSNASKSKLISTKRKKQNLIISATNITRKSK